MECVLINQLYFLSLSLSLYLSLSLSLSLTLRRGWKVWLQMSLSFHAFNFKVCPAPLVNFNAFHSTMAKLWNINCIVNNIQPGYMIIQEQYHHRYYCQNCCLGWISKLLTYYIYNLSIKLFGVIWFQNHWFSLVVMQNCEGKYFCSDFFPMALKWIDAAFTKALCYQNMPHSKSPQSGFNCKRSVKNCLTSKFKYNTNLNLGVLRKGEGC